MTEMRNRSYVVPECWLDIKCHDIVNNFTIWTQVESNSGSQRAHFWSDINEKQSTEASYVGSIGVDQLATREELFKCRQNI